MENTKVLKSKKSSLVTRILIFSIIEVSAILMFSLMFSLAITAHAATLTRQLQVGMNGQDVSDLQTFLATDSTIYPQGLVTGHFGFLTKAAVSNFQVRNGIDSVGRVGPITLVAINNKMNGDTLAPSIYSLNLSVSNTTATLNWNTSENAAAIVYYSTSPLSMIRYTS